MKHGKNIALVAAFAASLGLASITTAFAADNDAKYDIWELKAWEVIFIPSNWTCTTEFFNGVKSTIDSKLASKEITEEEAKTLQDKWDKHKEACTQRGYMNAATMP